MKQLAKTERESLLALLRHLSPRSLPVRRPEIGKDLIELENRALPRRCRAVLFDVYGTLVSSGASGEPLALTDSSVRPEGEAMKGLGEALLDLGFNEGITGFISGVAARIKRSNVEARANRPFPEIDIEEILAGFFKGTARDELRRLAVFLECSVNPCAPMPGAKGTLLNLETAGIPMGLVSNAQFYTPLLLEALFGEPLGSRGISPELCVYSYESGIAKPDPEFFARASRLLGEKGIGAQDTLVVGNSAVNDIGPAKENGFMTALVALDSRSYRPPEKNHASTCVPDTVISDFTALPRISGN